MSRLILGAGKSWPKEPGDIFVDIRKFEGIDVAHDLNVTPWPFKDNSSTEISAIHLVEHLKDLLTFMNECWRVLEKGGELYIETPMAGADIQLTHADPTHVRCYTQYTWINYFTKVGIAKFGYTDKPWAILNCQVDSVIRIHLTPIK